MNRKELLLLSIGIFLTVFAWLITDIYHAATEDKIKTKVEWPIIKKHTLNNEILKTLQEKSP